MRRTRRLFSDSAARALKPRLDAFLEGAPVAERVGFDPVELPHRYRAREDVELAALLAASLAYGRADLFKPKVEAILGQMGPHPGAFVREMDVADARRLLKGFVYRFNVGTDVAVLLLGAGRLMRDGGLETAFAGALERTGSLHAALAGFTSAIREAAPLPALRRALGPERGLDHLLPSPLGPGAAKRLNLFLRWMVRGPDEVDFGLWRSVPRSALMIPLDTHIGRIARHLGLTSRNDLSWRTAEEVTEALRKLDPADPVRYDFALCHYGMSGVCPATPVKENCQACQLAESCRIGRRHAKPRAPNSRLPTPNFSG